MTSAKVSVLIPCFRQAHYLRGAIQCALDQTHRPLQVIVINDGSDDDTDGVARSFGDRIVYIAQENKGLSAARNAGLRAAQGKYVHCLDSDDLLHPQAIEWLVEAMEDREDRIAIMGYKNFEMDPLEAQPRQYLPSRKLPFPQMIHGNFGAVNAALLSRHMYLQLGGFDERLRACEDRELWLRAFLAGVELVTVPHVGAYYRRYAGSMSRDHHRMITARTQVAEMLHREFLVRQDVLQLWGRELLQHEYHLRRVWLASNSRAPQVATLSAMIHDLESRGFFLYQSRLRRCLDKALGRWSDLAALQYFKWFDRQKYASYSGTGAS